MTPIVTIPRPCPEDWYAMTPDGPGRYCGSCCRTVVDFTTWRNEDILRYLHKHRDKKVCGRVTRTQAVSGVPLLDISAEELVRQVARSRMSWLQKIATIVLLGLSVMFSSCFGGARARRNQAFGGWLNPLDFQYGTLDSPRRMILPEPVLADTDTDGIADQFDKCTGTPVGLAVDSHGCPIDTDGDGVPDYRDKQLITLDECRPVNADGVGKCPGNGSDGMPGSQTPARKKDSTLIPGQPGPK